MTEDWLAPAHVFENCKLTEHMQTIQVQEVPASIRLSTPSMYTSLDASLAHNKADILTELPR